VILLAGYGGYGIDREAKTRKGRPARSPAWQKKASISFQNWRMT
jgi:hypothetical protein